jgi:predicted enzyme related to lactoylglutathione lyase
MKIVEIAFTGYPVTDLKRARAFYEGTLKLEPSRTFGGGDQAFIEYDLGPATFAIANMAGEDWKPSKDGPCLAFEVDDFDAAIADLRKAGTRFYLEPMDTPVCRMAVVGDPDGNSITIHKRKEAS